MYHILLHVTIGSLNKYEVKIFIGANLFFIPREFEKQIAISITILSKIIIKYFCHWEKKKEEVNNLRKETFYVQTKVFEKGLTASEMCVYFFLCSCANKEGICFPTRRKIRTATGLCNATITNSIARLKSKNMLTYTPQYTKSSGGKMRQTSNLYQIFDLSKSEE